MKRHEQIPRQALEKFVLGFHGRELSEELRGYLAGGLAGVVVYARNYDGPEDLLRLAREIRSAAGQPVLIGIDQEGGTRFALREPFTQWPSAEELGRLDDPAATEKVARGIARELAAAGCNVDFAPMLDLHLQKGSAVTSERSFGADPERVGEMGAAFAHGLAAEGILGCAKHFPGHGDTKIDPHESLPIYDGTLERLRQTELRPFALAVAQGVPLIMTAHILLPNIDADHPASLSRRILTSLLRDEMKFGGVIIADDLGMGAIRGRVAPGEAAIKTLAAGSDIAMLCHDWASVAPTVEKVGQALEKRQFPPSEWEASRMRIEVMRGLAGRASQGPSLGVVGCAAHRALAQSIHARAAAIGGS